MLTKLNVFSSLGIAPALPALEAGFIETDPVQILHIDGLNPVNASVNTVPYGSIDGSSHIGDTVTNRNIVLTLKSNPDWVLYTPAALRRLIYSYFMPKRPVKLIFESDDIVDVEISGIVESVSPNIFSKDLEIQVSIVCSKPHFSSTVLSEFSGSTIRYGGAAQDIPYNGNIEAGFTLRITHTSGEIPNFIELQIRNATIAYFRVNAGVDSTKRFEMSSIPLNKFVQNVRTVDSFVTNLLSQVSLANPQKWPTMQPGVNEFSVITDQGVQGWNLKFYERYGGL